MLEKSSVTVVLKRRFRTLCANFAKFTRFPFDDAVDTCGYGCCFACPVN